MGRARTIRPEFFKHERLATLSPLHRLLFIGLWTQADRDGKLEDRPMRLKVECLPYDSCKIDSIIDDLIRHPDCLIVRYEVGGRPFLKIPHFGKHQRVHPKEPASQLPDIPDDFFPESCMAMDGLCMNHGCPIHDQALEGKEGIEGKEGRGAGKPAFEVFWKHWPKHVEKQEALKVWARLRLDDVPAIMAGLERWKQSGQWEDPQFVPNPDKWLRRRKWEDEPEKRAQEIRFGRAPVEPSRGAETNQMTDPAAVAAFQERRRREAAGGTS